MPSAFRPDPTAALRPRTAHALAPRGCTLISPGTDKLRGDTALLTALDQALGDGNLTTGNIRPGSTNALGSIVGR